MTAIGARSRGWDAFGAGPRPPLQSDCRRFELLLSPTSNCTCPNAVLKQLTWNGTPTQASAPKLSLGPRLESVSTWPWKAGIKLSKCWGIMVEHSGCDRECLQLGPALRPHASTEPRADAATETCDFLPVQGHPDSTQLAGKYRSRGRKGKQYETWERACPQVRAWIYINAQWGWFYAR